jgi:hypothetical protein
VGGSAPPAYCSLRSIMHAIANGCRLHDSMFCIVPRQGGNGIDLHACPPHNTLHKHHPDHCFKIPNTEEQHHSFSENQMRHQEVHAGRTVYIFYSFSLSWMCSLSDLMHCCYNTFVGGLIAVDAGAMLGLDITSARWCGWASGSCSGGREKQSEAIAFMYKE